MTKVGRPQKNIDREQFEKLCIMQCTLDEVAGWFNCSQDTIERWCKRTYNENFAEVYKKKSQKGKISLRRAQFRLAEKSAVMAIFLGKQYLGQNDNPDLLKTDTTDNGFVAALNKTAAEDWQDYGKEDTTSDI